MFSNKHVIAALLVAPILAIIAYFGVDYVVSEKPHHPEQGAAYQLVAKSNCRYQSGLCEMSNGNFSISIRGDQQTNNRLVMEVESLHPVRGIGISISDQPEDHSEPLHMEALDQSYTRWGITIERADQTSSEQQIRLALSSGEAFYYGESGLAFLEYDPSYKKDFR